MKMDRRLSNGLAWAGALLVIGIPAADYLTGAFANTDAPRVAVVDAEAEAPAIVPPTASKPQEQVAEAASPAPKPAAKPQAVASSADPVAGFLQSGKPLPSYITGGDTTATAAPAEPTSVPQATPPASSPPQGAVTPAPASPPQGQTSEQVATVPALVAPVPMPLSMRPKPSLAPPTADQPLIIDEAAVRPVAPVPPQQSADFITSEDLEEWESGPLSEFLARRGQQSSVTYQVQQNEPAYDENGFWLDEGPRGRRPIGRYPRTHDDVYYLPF